MSTIFQDLRYALRQLRRSPGFAVTAVLTLALGIGVTATVAGVARQVLLAPLPYPQPDRLVGVAFAWPGGPAGASEIGESYQFLARNSRSFAASTLINAVSATANLSDHGGHASSIAVLGVSQGYFDTLGTRPVFGRPFTAEEELPGGPHALVLSYGLWVQAFGSDPSILGRTLRLNQESVTVVGIMPAEFRAQTYLSHTAIGSPQAWRPLQLSSKDPAYGGDNYEMFARLRSGVTIGQAQGEAQALERDLYRVHPDYWQWKNQAGQTRHFEVSPLSAVVAGKVHDSLLVMLWAAGAMLLLTSVNLAGLNTARALRRGGEFALRMALGASPGRLVELAIVETGLLAFGGVTGAVLTVRLLLPLLLRASPIAMPTLDETASAWSTAGVAALLGMASGAVFGTPLALAALLQGRHGVRPSSPNIGQTKTQVRAGQSLIVLQIGLAVVLVATASLLLGTFLRLRASPVGFAPDKLVVFQANLKGDRYGSTGETARFVDKALASLRATPGVTSAAAIDGLPFDRALNDVFPMQDGSSHFVTVQFRPVSPGYIRTIGLPLMKGRDLAEDDSASRLPVALASLSTVRHLWPGKPGIGQTFQLMGATWRVVGIVADAPNHSPGEEYSASVYVPLAQLPDNLTKAMNGWFPASFVVRMAAHLDAAALSRRAVAAADPEIPLAKLTTMQQLIDSSIAAPRFFTQLASGFGGFSLLLTAVGLFGLLNYQVTQRTHEIGVRMALGASRERILRGVLVASGWLVIAGGTIGLLAALWLRPLLTHWIAVSVIQSDSAESGVLFNRSAAILIAVALLAVTAFFAAALPARRASQVDPIEALRTE